MRYRQCGIYSVISERRYLQCGIYDVISATLYPKLASKGKYLTGPLYIVSYRAANKRSVSFPNNIAKVDHSSLSIQR
jgi:hypothetical protein